MLILLIDDDKDLCAITKMALAKHGLDVHAFTDAPSGIAFARKHRPNLILMDVMLPGLSGPEIVHSLQSDPQLKYVPVVFSTGLVTGSEKNIQEEGLQVAGIKYPTLGKPYEIETLLRAVHQYARE